LVGDISAGTGFAGPFASGTLLISKAVGLSSQILFFIEIPTIFIYFFAFKWLVDQKKSIDLYQKQYFPKCRSTKVSKLKITQQGMDQPTPYKNSRKFLIAI
jgi:hypothetical protein